MVLFHSVLNVCMLALLLVFAFQYQVVRNTEVADARYTLGYYLFSSGERTHAFLHRRIETIDEFVSILARTVRAYYDLPSRSRGLFMHYTDFNGTRSRQHDGVAAPALLLQYHEGYSASPLFQNIISERYELTLSNPIGPFSNASALLRSNVESCVAQQDHVAGGTFIPCRVSAIGDLLDRVVQLQLSFSLFSRSQRWSGGEAMVTVPSSWDVVVDYGFEGHRAVMTMEASLFSVSQRRPEQGPLLVCWLTILLALLDLHRRLGTEARAVKAAKGKHAATAQLVGSRRVPVGASEVQEGGWRWLGYASNAVVIAFAGVALFAQHLSQTGDTLEEAVTLLLAFAALLSSFRLVVLLKLFPSWYVLIDGLATALAQLSVLAVGVVPVLVGFAVCGTAVFGGFTNATYFQSIPAAIVTMLCSMFGDNLIDTFLRMDQSPHELQILFARLFFVTFMALFVCNILNIAHSIIQDSYSHALKSYASMKAAQEAAAMNANAIAMAAAAAAAGAAGGPRGHASASGSGAAVEGPLASGKDAQGRRGCGTEVCACEPTSPGSSYTSMTSHDSSKWCEACGLPRTPPRHGGGGHQDSGGVRRRRELSAADVERMLRRLNKVSQ